MPPTRYAVRSELPQLPSKSGRDTVGTGVVIEVGLAVGVFVGCFVGCRVPLHTVVSARALQCPDVTASPLGQDLQAWQVKSSGLRRYCVFLKGHAASAELLNGQNGTVASKHTHEHGRAAHRVGEHVPVL